jgi:hypothetical protein
MSKRKIIETESHPNDDEPIKLAPEDIDESKQSIEEAAYYIGMKRNQYGHPGNELDDWLEAERAVKENLD